MTDTTTLFERVMHELKPRPATVASVEDVTPSYRRITLTGEALSDFVSLAPTDHIKFQIDVDGEPVRRDYTPRRFENGELVVEFALHADGPLTTWARNAQPGSEATILGPRGSKVVKPVFDAYVVIGDDTMLPAAGKMLEGVPADARALAVIEVESAASEIDLPAGANAEVVYGHLNGGVPGEALVKALRGIEWPEGNVFVWAGGEAGAMRDVRRFLLNDVGLPREHLSMSGHWKRGESNFDHHAPIEE